MIDWKYLKDNCTLEDFYNILCRNKPYRNSKIFKEWDYLESITYEELLIEDERSNNCESIINEIIEFLKKQRKLKGFD